MQQRKRRLSPESAGTGSGGYKKLAATDGTLQIFVKLPDRTMTLDVTLSDTIDTVKQRIRDKDGRWPVSAYWLVHGGKPLQEGTSTLRDYNVAKESTLHTRFRAGDDPRDIKIKVVTVGEDDSIELVVGSGSSKSWEQETVKSVKKKLAKIRSEDASLYRLRHSRTGALLDDAQTLLDCDIVLGAPYLCLAIGGVVVVTDTMTKEKRKWKTGWIALNARMGPSVFEPFSKQKGVSRHNLRFLIKNKAMSAFLPCSVLYEHCKDLEIEAHPADPECTLTFAAPGGVTTALSTCRNELMASVVSRYCDLFGVSQGALAFSDVTATTVVGDYLESRSKLLIPDYKGIVSVQIADSAQSMGSMLALLKQLRDATLLAMSQLPYYSRYAQYCTPLLEPTAPVHGFVARQFQQSLTEHRGVPQRIGGGGDYLRPRPLLTISRIERVQNPRLVDVYKACIGCIEGLNRPCAPAIPDVNAPLLVGSTLNEYFLFHGAPSAVLQRICEGGFDPRRGGANAGKMFGTGTYFAENASKADRYSEPSGGAAGGERSVLMARVCLGATHVTRVSMPTATMPPDRQDGKAPLDSVTAEKATQGGAVDLREYVVYTASQALPEYRIWYKHDQRCECARCRD
jgi:large subunit ribosomal protein L40e